MNELLGVAIKWVAKAHVSTLVYAMLTALAIAGTWFGEKFYPSDATKADVTAVDKQIQDEIAQWIKTSNDRWGYQIRNSILQMAEQRCALPRGSPLRNEYNKQIQDGTARYRATTGDTTFTAPGCDEL